MMINRDPTIFKADTWSVVFSEHKLMIPAVCWSNMRLFVLCCRP